MAPTLFASIERIGLFAICAVTCCLWGITSENYVQDLVYLILATLAYVVGFSNSGSGKPSAKGAKWVDDDDQKIKFGRQGLPNSGRHRLPTDGDGGGIPEGSAEGKGERKTWYAPKRFRCKHIYDEMERREMLMKVIQTAQKEGYTPDIPSFQVLIEAVSVCEHVEMSLHMFGRMVETSAIQTMYPDWINKELAQNFFRMVANNLDEQTLREHGLELLKLVQACGLEPTKLFQNRVIAAWKSKLPLHVLNFFLQMRQWGVLLSSAAYRCIMINSERSDPAKTLMLFEEMMELGGMKIDAATFNAAMRAACQLGRPVDALKIGEQMPGAMRNGKTYGILIDACASGMKNKEAVEFFDAMLADGFQPNRFAYDHVIECCIREEKVDKAIKLFKQMIDEGLMPWKTMRGRMFFICTKKGRMADVAHLLNHHGASNDPAHGAQQRHCHMTGARGAQQKRQQQQAPPQPAERPAKAAPEAAKAAPEAGSQIKVARWQKAAAGQQKAAAGEAAGNSSATTPQ